MYRAVKKILTSILNGLTGLSLTLSFYYSPKAQAKSVNLGGIQVDMSFCEQYDKWSGILSSYSNVVMPVGGYLGITTGVMTNTSLIVDFCSYMIQMASLDTQGKIFATAQMANKLSGDQHTENIDYTASLWDLSNKVWDFEKGKGNPAALQSQSFHRSMANMIRRTGKKAGYKMENRQEQERSMGRLARISYQRSILKNANQCPAPKDNTDYQKLYEKEILPLENANEVLEEYINFYKEALLSMGLKIMDSDTYPKYIEDLEAVVYKSSTFVAEIKDKNFEATVLKEKKTKPIKASESRTEEVSEKFSKKFQEFKTPKLNTIHQKNFINKYDKLWNTWVTANAYSTTRGILNKPEKKVEDEFKDFSILCNRGKYGAQYDRQDPEYYEKVEKALEQCRNDSTQVISSSGGLMSYYIQSLVQKEYQLKTNKGKIWTFESLHLGHVRSVTEEQSADALSIYTQPEVQCAPITNLAVINQMQLKQTALNAELNQEIVEQLLKQNAMEEARLREVKEREERLERERKIHEETERRRININDEMIKPNLDNIQF